MGKLTSFTFISLNGFYKSLNNDISWHLHGEEEERYSIDSLNTSDILLFGRVTYDLMSSFWQSQQAFDTFPEVAKAMNASDKIVVSRSMKSADWQNTSILNDNFIDTIIDLKEKTSKSITLLGSGTVLKHIASANIVDEYQIMIDPLFLSNGFPILNNLNESISLELISSKVFKSGKILLYYRPLHV